MIHLYIYFLHIIYTHVYLFIQVAGERDGERERGRKEGANDGEKQRGSSFDDFEEHRAEA